MKKTWAIAATLSTAAGVAQAGGLDRSGQSTAILFEDGNYAELSYGYTDPTLTGTDLLANSIADVGDSFSLLGGGLKFDINPKLSAALIFDQPFGADVHYGGSNATTMLGGTSAVADTASLTALMRYKLDEAISIYAGPRYITADGEITLSGLAYGPPLVFLPASANNYTATFGSTSGIGYVVGTAYERPDIALRVALTYNTSIDLDFPTTETQNGVLLGVSQDTQSEAPQSVNLDFQTGIAQDTLLFGSIRWAEWSKFSLAPSILTAELAELEDSTTYTLGVGRRFSEKFAGSISVSYESGGSDDLVSPLAPTNGFTAITLGGRYEFSEQVTLSGGVRYTMFGDSKPETGTPDTARASFTDNDALSIGFKLGYHF